MKYLDTNVIGYAVEQHPKYGSACTQILRDVQNGTLKACASRLVLVEFLGVLRKINGALSQQKKKPLDISINIDAILSLPIVWLDLDIAVIRRASTYQYTIPGADFVHLATMDVIGITEIISADADFDKAHVKRQDPLRYDSA